MSQHPRDRGKGIWNQGERLRIVLKSHFHSTKREGERGRKEGERRGREEGERGDIYLQCQKGPEYRVLLLSLLSLHSYQIPGE
jgi:hypothetical protein